MFYDKAYFYYIERINYLMKIRKYLIILFVSFFMSNSFAMNNSDYQYTSLKDVPEEIQRSLLEKKIFFGHQSVGGDLLNGIEDLKVDYPWLQIKIKELKDVDDFSQPSLSHSYVGQNEKPKTKSAAFKEILETDLMGRADIAALKFCYIDFNINSDVENIFNEYVAGIDSVKDKNPDLIIIHFTVPLTTVQSGVKAWVKGILGRPIGGLESNIKRNEYNLMLEKKYSGKDLIFDIARFESTIDGGERQEFQKDGTVYYSLNPEFTYDGGHLNETGRKYIAEQFILFIINEVL